MSFLRSLGKNCDGTDGAGYQHCNCRIRCTGCACSSYRTKKFEDEVFTPIHFVNTDDFEAFKNELEKALSEKFETLGAELFKSLKKSLEKDKAEEAKNQEDDESDEDDDEEEAKDNGEAQNVQSSKSIPNHDIKDNQKVAKTGAARVYEIMGRDNTGSAVRKL